MGPHQTYHNEEDIDTVDIEAAPTRRPTTTRTLPAQIPLLGSSSLPHLDLSQYQKKPIVRWAGLAIVLGVSAWLLYPYFLGLASLLDKRPGYLKSPSMVFPDEVDVGVPLDAVGSKLPPFGLGEPTFVGIDRPDWNGRREKVRAAYKHALTGYLDHAFPNDELAPVTGAYTNKLVVVIFFRVLVVDFFFFLSIGIMGGACR